MRKCDWCDNNSKCSGATRTGCITRDYINFSMHNDHAYIFGKKKDGAKENVMSDEQLEESRRIARSICEEYSITWDESAKVATLNGELIQKGDIAKAFGTQIDV